MNDRPRLYRAAARRRGRTFMALALGVAVSAQAAHAQLTEDGSQWRPSTLPPGIRVPGCPIREGCAPKAYAPPPTSPPPAGHRYYDFAVHVSAHKRDGRHWDRSFGFIDNRTGRSTEAPDIIICVDAVGATAVCTAGSSEGFAYCMNDFYCMFENVALPTRTVASISVRDSDMFEGLLRSSDTIGNGLCRLGSTGSTPCVIGQAQVYIKEHPLIPGSWAPAPQTQGEQPQGRYNWKLSHDPICQQSIIGLMGLEVQHQHGEDAIKNQTDPVGGVIGEIWKTIGAIPGIVWTYISGARTAMDMAEINRFATDHPDDWTPQMRQQVKDRVNALQEGAAKRDFQDCIAPIE